MIDCSWGGGDISMLICTVRLDYGLVCVSEVK